MSVPPVPNEKSGRMPSPKYQAEHQYELAAQVRPGIVTAAGVLGFIIGGVGFLLNALSIGNISAAKLSPGLTALLTALTLVGIAMDLAMLFGARQALAGKDSRILVIAAGVAILIQIVGMFIYFTPSSLVSLVIPGLIIGFLLSNGSLTWFRVKGGKTF